jgi:signal transduction histidine kinase/ActR/RegA family two-component response regulator
MRFRDLPIRRKLLLMTLASSAAALVLASSGFLVWDVAQYRIDLKEDVEAQAQIISDNSGAPLAFGDDRAAGETLAVLKLRPRVRVGCLYTTAGRLFATYLQDRTAMCPAEPNPTRFGWDLLESTSPVRVGREQVGTLYIARDLGDLYTRLRVGALTVAGFLVLSIVAAFLIAARMQHAIAAPLLDLARTARGISASRDYSRRAATGSNDEVGVVVDAFNDMLDRIAEQTTELSRTNAELEREVDERRRVEIERTAALERERDANRLKDEFLATLSHELRTPLNAVLGWTRVLRTAQVEPRTQTRALESIERNAQAQVRLIEDLLEVSRIVTGKLRLQVRDTDLAAIVDAAVEVVQPAAVAKRLSVTVEIKARPAMTAADPDRLQQVVWNLLSNAVKVTPAEGSIIVTLEQRAAGHHLAVSDSGPGIDAKFLPFVFEPFRQADGTSSREHGGLGLGLAIAKQLVELHGGTIAAYSRGRGSGATFEVDLPSVLGLPIPSVTRTAVTAPFAASPLEPGLLHDLHVLVVDDEEDARTLMQATLSQFGADVVTAGSAADALAEIDRRHPDVMLSDIGMPHEDGFSLIRQLRSRSAADGGEIPAVAITAYASAQDRTAVAAAGFQAHVAKPFDPSRVAALVAQLGRIEHERMS